MDNVKAIAKYFKLDEERFEILAVSIYGTEHLHLSLICIDKNREEKDYIVKLSVPVDNNILSTLFKRLNIILHDKSNKTFDSLEFNEESNFMDYHQ